MDMGGATGVSRGVTLVAKVPCGRYAAVCCNASSMEDAVAHERGRMRPFEAADRIEGKAKLTGQFVSFLTSIHFSRSKKVVGTSVTVAACPWEVLTLSIGQHAYHCLAPFDFRRI